MLHVALSLAETNVTYPKWRFGAVIVKGGSVISTGRSKKRNAPANVPDGDNCSEHAEMAALRRASKSDLRGGTIFVARVGRSGENRIARPCANCAKALSEAGVRKVVYTSDDGVVEAKIADILTV